MVKFFPVTLDTDSVRLIRCISYKTWVFWTVWYQSGAKGTPCIYEDIYKFDYQLLFWKTSPHYSLFLSLSWEEQTDTGQSCGNRAYVSCCYKRKLNSVRCVTLSLNLKTPLNNSDSTISKAAATFQLLYRSDFLPGSLHRTFRVSL